MSRDGSILNSKDKPKSASKHDIQIGSIELAPKPLNCSQSEWSSTCQRIAMYRAHHHINVMIKQLSNVVSHFKHQKASDTGLPISLKHFDLLYLKEHGRVLLTQTGQLPLSLMTMIFQRKSGILNLSHVNLRYATII